jgi:hypothetical protein
MLELLSAKDSAVCAFMAPHLKSLINGPNLCLFLNPSLTNNFFSPFFLSENYFILCPALYFTLSCLRAQPRLLKEACVLSDLFYPTFRASIPSFRRETGLLFKYASPLQQSTKDSIPDFSIMENSSASTALVDSTSTHAQRGLADCPLEIPVEIAKCAHTQADLNSLCRTNRYFYAVL